MTFQIVQGFAEHHKADVAQMFWQAFEGKLSFAMAPKHKALAFIEHNLNANYAISAVSEANEILGVAGFKTEAGGLLCGEFRDIAKVYGWPSACWRAPILDLFERDLVPTSLLMDGIFVCDTARGYGVGTGLLNAIINYATSIGKDAVELDVINTNLKAKALYQRLGFQDVSVTKAGMLKGILGFETATRMTRRV